MNFSAPSLLRRLRAALSLLVAMTSIPTYAAESASSEPPRWRFETMRPRDLAEALRTRPIAWLVLSPLEWHGEAISFNADPLVGHAILEGAWKKVGGVLIPTLYIGSETEYKEWDSEKGLVSRWGMELISREHNPGSLYVRPITLELVLVDYLKGLQREGFKLCVVTSGHGGAEHVDLMEEVCRRDYGGMKVLMWRGWSEELPEHLRFKDVGGASHANIVEASLVGGVDPTLVDRSAFGVLERDRKTGLKSENASEIDFEKGRAIVELRAAALAKKVEEMLAELK